MELVYAGNLPDAEALRRVLGEQGIHTLLVAVLFAKLQDVGEARRIVESMEGRDA